jgi:transcriptional regulator with XRE-family HTH domain
MSTAVRNRIDLPVWTIGDRMAKARMHVGLDQTQMAEQLQSHRRSISRWENLPNPPRAIVLAYAEITGIPAWWILGSEPAEPGEATVTHQKRGLVTPLRVLLRAA